MREYVLSVDESVVSQVERYAQGRPLEALVRDLLNEYVMAQQRVDSYEDLVTRLRSQGPLPVLSREQRNER